MNQDSATPRLCTPGNVLLGLLASTGLAICLALASVSRMAAFWPALGLNAVFIYLVVLTVALVLCSNRGGPLRHSGPGASWTVFGLIQVIVIAYSLVVIAAEPWLAPLELSAHSDPGFFLARNIGISLIAALILTRYLALQQRWRAQVAAESSARMDSLQARIHPHFLFNTLNTISSLIADRPDQAEQATLDLSDLLRTGLRTDSRHSLGEELELVRGYLRIESLRLADRLEIDWALAEDLPLDRELPALLIQPLVENAIVHGIARLPEGGRLTIRGERLRHDRLRFVIENPMPRSTGPTSDDNSNDNRPEGNHMALENIRQRLELAYEDGARLKAGGDNGQFQVELRIPGE